LWKSFPHRTPLNQVKCEKRIAINDMNRRYFIPFYIHPHQQCFEAECC
jgi:hypothetical protein